MYPDDLSIFATKWTYEYQKGILDIDSLEPLISYLEKEFPNNPDIPFLKLIAYTHLNKINEIYKLLDKLLQMENLKFSANSIYLTGRISNILSINHDNSPILIKRIFSKLFKDNPYSYFVYSLIRSGLFKRSEILDSQTVINVLNKIIQNYIVPPPYLLLKKTELLSYKFTPDSLKEVEDLIDCLISYYENYNRSDSIYIRGLDPKHEFKQCIGLFPSTISFWANKTKNPEKGIYYLSRSLNFTPPLHPIRGFIYYDMGNLFAKFNLDSAIKYYSFALQSLPPDAEGFKKLVVEKVGKLSQFSKLGVDSLIKMYRLPKVYLKSDFSNSFV